MPQALFDVVAEGNGVQKRLRQRGQVLRRRGAIATHAAMHNGNAPAAEPLLGRINA